MMHAGSAPVADFEVVRRKLFKTNRTIVAGSIGDYLASTMSPRIVWRGVWLWRLLPLFLDSEGLRHVRD